MLENNWWHEAIIYQIYPRSFFDTTNNGIGDLKGIIQKLDYIESLGVNTLWINPITASAQVDNGYDSSNYTKIDPLFGTEEVVDLFFSETKKRGLKVIYDFPLNHTSDQHMWFKEALKGPDNPYRDYYVWADGPDEGLYPNNWTAAFGGSAWTKEMNGDQYYLHIFKKEMPELNWDHEPLRKDMAKVLNYLIDKGIDGIRLDAFIFIDVDKRFPDKDPDMETQDLIEYGENLKKYVKELKASVRARSKDIFVIGEATSADAQRIDEYTQEELLDGVITLSHFTDNDDLKIDELPEMNQHVPLDFDKFKRTQKAIQEHLADRPGPILFWNNHDRPRSPQKYGDMDNYRDETAKMMATLLYLQKGIPIIYYGEEVGMNNSGFEDPSNISDNGALSFYESASELGWSHDKIMKNLNLTVRDASRGIMQWSNTKWSGFTEDAAPWIISHQEATYNVEDQEKDENSILNYYRKLIELKKQPLFTRGGWKLLDTEKKIYAYKRNYEGTQANVFCNFSDEERVIENIVNASDDQLVLSTHDAELKDQKMVLPAYSAFVFVSE
ncbi:alpha-amylase family glycosyl hydrolase [Marinilactibacillus kalidii]|uniref:alpha-amylase family glycosyl hydrolase n=1 Tax=Marinilactibacillus kalidii TaxID=2820274 RepID=UPI001ABE691E|nr:alpha-amylase family glycosyl hydrolase [Marinilactibacillus kalidii]